MNTGCSETKKRSRAKRSKAYIEEWAKRAEAHPTKQYTNRGKVEPYRIDGNLAKFYSG